MWLLAGPVWYERGEAGRDKGPCVDALERDTCVGALAMVDTFVVGLFATVVVVVDVVAVVVVVDVVVVVVVRCENFRSYESLEFFLVIQFS